jgi:hypothetical protein
VADGAIAILGTVSGSRGRCSLAVCYSETPRLTAEHARVLFHSGGLNRRERGYLLRLMYLFSADMHFFMQSMQKYGPILLIDLFLSLPICFLNYCGRSKL